MTPPAPGRDDTTGAGDVQKPAILGYFVAMGDPCSSCSRGRSECRTPGSPFLSCCTACAQNDGDTHNPAATPGRDELREQIAAARPLSRAERDAAGSLAYLLETRDPAEWDNEGVRVIFRRAAVTIQLLLREAAAVMESVDAWVAAHTAEVEALRAKVAALDEEAVEILLPLVTYLCDNHADRYGGNHCIDVAIDLLTESDAAVARVRALGGTQGRPPHILTDAAANIWRAGRDSGISAAIAALPPTEQT